MNPGEIAYSSWSEFDAPLLPVQYYGMLTRPRPPEGEFRLMLAVLEDAIRCYLKNMRCRTETQRRLFYEVQQWFSASDSCGGGQGPFAFENLCEALGIKPGLLRERLGSLHLRDLPTRRHRRASPHSEPRAQRSRVRRSRRPSFANSHA